MKKEQMCLKCKNTFWGEPSEMFCPSCESDRVSENRRAYRETINEISFSEYPTLYEEMEHACGGNIPNLNFGGLTISSPSKEPVPKRKTIEEPRPIKNIQQVLENKYPNKDVEVINLDREEAEGELDLSNYPNLKLLWVADNKLTSTNFLNTIPNPKRLVSLRISENNIQPTDIEIFSEFISLRQLKIGTSKSGLKKGKHNHFFGSLKSYQNLTKLESICIEATDVNEGLEYLPLSLAQSITQRLKEDEYKGSYSLIECSPNDTNAKCKVIKDKLKPLNYDIEAWQLTHPHLMYKSYPEYFTNPESKDKWLKALDDKLIKTQTKLQETKDKEPQAIKRIERLTQKIQRLKGIKKELEAKKKTNDEKNREIKTDETQAIIEYPTK